MAARRLAALDGLRGVAIALVAASHYLPARVEGLAAFEADFVGLGRGGVTLFFLLSGYLMIRNLERQPLAVFVPRRLFKIMPSYWLNALVMAVLGLPLLGLAPLEWNAYAANAVMLTDVLRLDSLNGVYWTLLIEIKFYVFIALQYAVLRGRGWFWVFVGLVSLMGLGHAVQGKESLLLTYFPAFYIGIAIERAERADWAGWPLAALVACVALLALAMARFLDAHALASAGGLVAAALAFVAALRWGLDRPVLSYLGRVSYSGYLYHSLIGTLVFAAFAPYTGWVGDVAALATASALSVLVATGLCLLVEEPLVRLGRRLEGNGGKGICVPDVQS